MDANQTKTYKKSLNKIFKSLPHRPGVYIYKNSDSEIIYIGKAVDLNRRVNQYFTRDDAVGEKTNLLVSQIDQIEHIETLNEFDALLLEAKLINQHKPKYNVIAKDDKSPLYIKLTLSEELPRIEYVRKPRNEVFDLKKKDAIFGPFQSGKTARNLMRQLRNVVPFCTQKQRNGKSCFYTHIGLCDPCPSQIIGETDETLKKNLTHKYRENLYLIRDILDGKSNVIINNFTHVMEEFAQNNEFEKAAIIRDHLNSLYSIVHKRFDPMLYVQSDFQLSDVIDTEVQSLEIILKKYIPNLSPLKRIECIDISNIFGLNATGSLVVLTNGLIDKSQYRKFKIRTDKFPNDFAMIAEVITRRFNHPEWQKPNLLVVDGGKGQVTSVVETLQKLNLYVSIIGLAKRQEEIIIPINHTFKTVRLPLNYPGLLLLERIRDEAHRFAITYHRKIREKAFTSINKV
jgi:excinuclease ABC subunit C